MYRGYIKLWRSIEDNPITKKPEYLSVWIYLLRKANYTDNELIFNNEKIVIKAGSFITSRAKICSATGILRSTVERILKYLENEHQIEQQSFNKFRIISICNWEPYQQTEQVNEQPVSSKRAASEQPVSTAKKEKKDKNIKNNTISDFVLPESIKKETWEAYLEMRKLIKKPATLNAQKSIIGKLLKMNGNPNDVLQQSIDSSWQNVYELKDGGNGNGTAGNKKSVTSFQRDFKTGDRKLDRAVAAEADAINEKYYKAHPDERPGYLP